LDSFHIETASLFAWHLAVRVGLGAKSLAFETPGFGLCH
jgi:hypothetical protein